MQLKSLLTSKRWLAYFAGVTVAALCFSVCLAMHVEIARLKSTVNVNFSSETLNLLLMMMFLFAADFFACVLVTVIPFFAAFSLAVRFQIKSVWFFILGGGLMGMCMSPLLAYLPNHAVNETFEVWMNEPSFVEKLYSFLPVCVLSGLAAGITVVLTLKRTELRVETPASASRQEV